MNREIFWDNIKGILIILVVFAHCIYDLQDYYWNNIIVDTIYFFHMPVFVFISGYFGRSEKSRSLISILKLLIAYILTVGIYSI